MADTLQRHGTVFVRLNPPSIVALMRWTALPPSVNRGLADDGRI